MSTKPMKVQEFFKKFPNDDACLEHVFVTRFGQSYACPKCKKATKWHKLTSTRAYSCQKCGHHLHPTVGTPFESSRTPLQLWFYAIYLFTTTRNGVAAKELQRQLGVTYKCAWRMGHEIRKHMALVDGDSPLSGHVEIDEVYIGGRDKKQGRPTEASNKTAVLGMLQRNGDIVLRVIEDTKGSSIIPHVREHVQEGTTISTDDAHVYKKLKNRYKHDSVNHSQDEWVRGDVHTNSIEGFWAHLQKGIGSTHIAVSKRHMAKYLGEFEYRFNSRSNPEQMFPELISSFVSQK